MADETVINGELSDDRTVEISGDEVVSSKIYELTQRITDLELENQRIVEENKGYEQKIEEVKLAGHVMSTDNQDLKSKLDKAESYNKALEEKAAALGSELSGLKRRLEEVKQTEEEKDLKLEAIGNEKDGLLSKVVQLEGIVGSLREEKEKKENEIQNLKKHIEKLQADLQSSKSLEKLKIELEKTIDSMNDEIASLENSLKEKQLFISELQLKQRNVTLGNGMIDGENKGSIAGLKRKDWVLVGGSTVAAIAVVGVASYLHAARKH